MRIFFSSLLLLTTLLLISSCKSKKKSLSGDEPVEIADFIDFFPAAKPGFQVSDTGLLKKSNDSLLISYKIFSQFVPDSILGKLFGKSAKPKIYPLAKVQGDETYLFAKTITGDKRAAYVFGFDKKNQFIAAMPLLSVDQSQATQQVSYLDNKYTIYKNITRRNSDGSFADGKEVYVLNSGAGAFTLIMTDALDDKVIELINPIDTFSRKQKFMGDYGSGAMNLFSFRDGRKADRISFFIHFEKSNGDCTGELKGEAILKAPNRAEYRAAGDPCSLQFTFSASAVTVKELEACGNHRGLRCSFDGNYARKKEAKPKPAKTKKQGSK